VSSDDGGTPLGGDSAQDRTKIDASSEGCDTCVLRNVGFCGAVMGANPNAKRRRKTAGSVLARQHILRPGEAPGRIIILRQGWALRSAMTSDGRRQVLSILLPGDIAGGELVMRDKVRMPVQSVTPVEYCAFDITHLKEIVEEDTALVWTFIDICLSSREASDARLIDLGRHNAEQRLARLILDLRRRLRARGLSDGATIPFPLRQQTIADALGLTQVHVSRVMRSLRQSRILQTKAGQLTILDMDALMAVADEFYET
jgi:CRP-like cAMP-binding protein